MLGEILIGVGAAALGYSGFRNYLNGKRLQRLERNKLKHDTLLWLKGDVLVLSSDCRSINIHSVIMHRRWASRDKRKEDELGAVTLVKWDTNKAVVNYCTGYPKEGWERKLHHVENEIDIGEISRNLSLEERQRQDKFDFSMEQVETAHFVNDLGLEIYHNYRIEISLAENSERLQEIKREAEEFAKDLAKEKKEA